MMRPYIGLVASILVVGIGLTLVFTPLTFLLGIVVCIAGGAGIYYGVKHVISERNARYDLRTLFETEPMPDDGEGVEDTPTYCSVCGTYVVSPYKPCTKCGAAL